MYSNHTSFCFTTSKIILNLKQYSMFCWDDLMQLEIWQNCRWGDPNNIGTGINWEIPYLTRTFKYLSLINMLFTTFTLCFGVKVSFINKASLSRKIDRNQFLMVDVRWAFIHQADGRLAVRSRGVSKPRYSGTAFFNRFGIWKAPRQQRSRDACQMLERYDYCNIQSRGFVNSRDLAIKYCGKTSVRLVNRCQEYMGMAALSQWYTTKRDNITVD